MKLYKYAALFAAITIIFTGCGKFGTAEAATSTTTTTITTTAESDSDSAVNDLSDSSENDEEKKKSQTFIAEFFDQELSFVDTAKTVENVMKTSGYEYETESTGSGQKITMKSSYGGGTINYMSIDMKKTNLNYGLDYLLGTFGDYYFDYTLGQITGITSDDLTSSYRMINEVITKGQYKRYSSLQKSNGMTNQFGYLQVYVVFNDNILTVVSGAFSSTDMMERSQFESVLNNLDDTIKY